MERSTGNHLDSINLFIVATLRTGINGLFENQEHVPECGLPLKLFVDCKKINIADKTGLTDLDSDLRKNRP
uniref:STAS domain-containing protein n=1 Tax=Panagrolaimus sp. JU765 TaxID=591449 RepID=A0AC34R8D5_9BILA